MNTHNPTHTETYRRLVAGTTINGTTLLSTDYLNHFNEFVMMLELTADMPDMAADIADWQPKSYAQHFADSGFSHADLAIAAYDHAPREFRVPLDDTISRIEAMIAGAVPRVGTLLNDQNPEATKHHIIAMAEDLRALIERASAIINGTMIEDLDATEPGQEPTMGQKDIDDLFD